MYIAYEIVKNVFKVNECFTMEKLGIDAEVQPGKEKTITVKPKMSGTHELIYRYKFREEMIGRVKVK